MSKKEEQIILVLGEKKRSVKKKERLQKTERQFFIIGRNPLRTQEKTNK